ncbi:MAG: sigma-70 family RNA polymerase sigma factor, partial [Pseudomonadota bacterium]
RKYSDKPAREWTPLFYRILNNRIRDFQRHGTVRSRVLALLPGARSTQDGAADVTQDAEDYATPGPQQQTMLDDSMQALDSAVGALPPRQREAFLLRTLEGLDVRDTASAMGCSEGSVKTHYFRAVGTLRAALGEHWPEEDGKG